MPYRAALNLIAFGHCRFMAPDFRVARQIRKRAVIVSMLSGSQMDLKENLMTVMRSKHASSEMVILAAEAIAIGGRFDVRFYPLKGSLMTGSRDWDARGCCGDKSRIDLCTEHETPKS